MHPLSIQTGLVTDPVALGLTRLPLFWGVPLKAFFINVMVAAILGLHTTLWLGFIAAIVGYVTLLTLTRYEPRYLHILWKAYTKTPPVLNSAFWGSCNSYEVA